MRQLAATAGLVILVGLVPAASASVDAARARAALAALDATYARADGLYIDGDPSAPANAWPFSQAVAAEIAVAALPGADSVARAHAAESVAALRAYRRQNVYASGHGGDVYVDDNLWIAFDLLDWSVVANDPGAVQTARRLLRFAVAHWDAAAADPCSGGVYWTASGSNRDRNAVTTGGTALLALRLVPLGGNVPALRWWSVRLLGWLDHCLRAPDGLYADHIDAGGAVEPRAWSYNQGLVIGALALAGKQGDPAALARAEALARSSLWFLDPARMWAEPPEFVAVLARNLLLLGSVDGDPSWQAAVQAYADAAWALRDPATGLFDVDGTGPKLIQQAALAQIYAALDAVTAAR